MSARGVLRVLSDQALSRRRNQDEGDEGDRSVDSHRCSPLRKERAADKQRSIHYRETGVVIEKPGSSRSSVSGLPQIPRVTSPNRNLIGSACRMKGWSEMTPEEELIQRYFD